MPLIASRESSAPSAATLDDLRRFAVARSLFTPTTLARAVMKLGFVQADPIRAPARAQDLMLRHRVANYRAGDLERRYRTIDVEEDTFVNYGFVPRTLQALMHPRSNGAGWSPARNRRAQALLAFMRERGTVHPRDVDRYFAHGQVTNYWGGTSNATTHLLEDMHYRGFVRVAGREAGVRLYEAREWAVGSVDADTRRSRIDALVDLVVGVYAPLPAASLATVVSRLRYAVPQWRRELKGALGRARQRLARAHVDGVDWYWPPGERLPRRPSPDAARLLTPFDPVVWDRRRFALFWNWEYRFEAYTPVAQRKRGYYALPLLWRDRVIGWGNLSVQDGRLQTELGFVDHAASRDPALQTALDEELARMRRFLALEAGRV